ncbi:FimV/HubP family polar landmark protein [Immundisolibacter sp.]|uniref:FimV/HubP family polar landmark protein n=1 Tax=Immundisolibacter sp. TaxID=1934948 RepID=UPI003F825971
MAKTKVADKKLRKALAPALLLPIGFAPMSAQALGLGTLHVDSALGQPLEARIDLVGATAAQAELATISLAPADARERMGLSDPMLGGVLLRFEVKVAPGGRSYVLVTSSGPVREPYLDFVLQAVSPSGQVVRHYTVLLDPVGTTAAPVSAALPAVPVAAPAPPPVRRRQPVRDPFANVAPPRPGAEFGPVPPGATLWSIARRVRPSGANLNDVMASIHRSNPQAFINGEPGLLKAGSRLTIPSEQVLRDGAPAAVAPGPATAEPVASGDSAPAPAEAAAETPPAETAAAVETPPAEVRVIRSEDVASDAPAEAAQGADETSVGSGGNRIQLLEEALDAAQQQNDAMQQRMAALEEQIRTMADLMKASGVEQSAVQGDAVAPVDTPAGDAPAAAAAESAVAPASSSETSGRPWAWLLAAVAAVGLGGLVVRSRRRREVMLIDDAPEPTTAGTDAPQAASAQAATTPAAPATRVEWVEQVPEPTPPEAPAAEAEPEPATEALDDGFGDPVDTQIDLLAAYVGMADGASARQVHAEIMRAGTAQQKAQAEALMAKLNG